MALGHVPCRLYAVFTFYDRDSVDIVKRSDTTSSSNNTSLSGCVFEGDLSLVEWLPKGTNVEGSWQREHPANPLASVVPEGTR